MTVAQANRLFGELAAGQSRKDVEEGLASRGIPASSEVVQRGGPSYVIQRRREDESIKGRWMDRIRNQTVAECAGLKVDAVHSAIRVWYPDADRSLFGEIEIMVYLFFDADGRLIRHWVDEFRASL